MLSDTPVIWSQHVTNMKKAVLKKKNKEAAFSYTDNIVVIENVALSRSILSHF